MSKRSTARRSSAPTTKTSLDDQNDLDDDDLSDEDDDDIAEADAASGPSPIDEVDVEAESLTSVLPNDLELTQDIKDVLKMGAHEFKADPPLLCEFPDIDAMYAQAKERIQNALTVTPILIELRNLHDILVTARQNELELKRKLRSREEEVHDLIAKIRRDPRVARALILADGWRKQKAEAEQSNNEYLLELSELRGDLKNLEAQITNIKKQHKKTSDQLEKAKLLEGQVEALEFNALKRENELAEMQQEIERVKEEAAGEIAEVDKHNAALKTKLQQVPAEHARAIEGYQRHLTALQAANVDLKSQVDELKYLVKRVTRTENNTRHKLGTVTLSLRHVQERLNRHEHQVRALNNKVLQLTIGKEKYRRDIQTLSLQVFVMRRHKQELMKQVEELTNERKVLNRELTSRETMNFKLRSEVESQRISLKNAEDHLNALNKATMKHKFAHDDCVQRTAQLQTKMNVIDSRRAHEASRAHETGLMLDNMEKTAQILYKNLEHALDNLEVAHRKISMCELEKTDKSNTIKHLESVLRARNETIRIRDAKNDSLVMDMSKLAKLLEMTKDDVLHLRQLNLVAETQIRQQLELHNMLTHMLNFMRAEKEHAMRTSDKFEDTIIILKRQQFVRLNEIAQMHKELNNNKLNIRDHIQALENQKTELHSLKNSIREAIFEHKRLVHENNSLRRQRDIFGATVIQRNTENQLLTRKMETVMAVINRCYTESRSRGNDMRILKTEIRNLRFQLRNNSRTGTTNTELRSELVYTHRLLTIESQKRKAIEEMKPTVPHPHRYLMNADASAYENILKIQRLQKMLIAKICEATDKEYTIISKENQLKQLKLLLTSRPGPEKVRDLHSAQAAIREKDRLIKSLVAEVNMLNFDLQENKRKSEGVLDELKTAKTEMADMKRKQIQSHCPKKLPTLQKRPEDACGRAVGGGFVFKRKQPLRDIAAPMPRM